MSLHATVYTDDDQDRVAISRRLGNISSVSHLRKLIAGILSSESILLTRVLYSGSHSGDYLSLDETLLTNAELDELAKVSGNTNSITEFICDLRSVVEVAIERRRPIHF